MNDSLSFLLEKSKDNAELTERIYATRNDRNLVNALCESATAEVFHDSRVTLWKAFGNFFKLRTIEPCACHL